MSYEIRTFLYGILGFPELLRNRNLFDDKKEHYIDIINTKGFVRVDCEEVQDRLYFKVTDTGIGIEQKIVSYF